MAGHIGDTHALQSKEWHEASGSGGPSPANSKESARLAKQRRRLGAITQSVGRMVADVKSLQEECLETTRSQAIDNVDYALVTLVGAQGLRAAGWGGNGLSEHSCRCEVIGKVRTRVDTPCIDDTKEPRWNFTAKLVDYEPGDSLLFTVVATHPDWRTWVDVLGRAELPTWDLPGGTIERDLPLKDAGEGVGASLRVRVSLPQSTVSGALRNAEEDEPGSLPAEGDAARLSRAKEPPQQVKYEEDLPCGWEAAWNKQFQRYYYYNRMLHVSQWDWPE